HSTRHEHAPGQAIASPSRRALHNPYDRFSMTRASIQVSRVGAGEPAEFQVVVHEGGTETRHLVTMAREDFERLAGRGVDGARCIEAAFRFLLDREPKESILARFDVTLISRYFPEFERELSRYVEKP
ncbi:MAG: hypothetical protein ACREQY_11585, partial [Candidatus Binatia bacterium]